jgi:hypothetical protein
LKDFYFLFRFFTELNDHIFKLLFEAENEDLNDYTDYKSSKFFLTRDKEVSDYRRNINKKPQTKFIQNDLIKKMELDPSDDKDFLNELIRFYDFNLKVI